MRRLGMALAAIGVLVGAPLAADLAMGAGDAQAQSASRAKRERGAKTPDPAAGRAAGMAAAPGLVQRAGLTCTPSDATQTGQSKAADGSINTVYEVVCSEGPGYILIAKADGSLADGYECFALKSGNEQQAAEGKAVANALTCKLPANADPIQGFRKVAGPLVPGCTIDQARYMGANAGTKQAIYEIGCQNRAGVVLRLSAPGGTGQAPSTIPCEQASGSIACQYTSADEKLTGIRELVAKSGRACQLTDGRLVGRDEKTGQTFYEAKCGDGAGFMAVANADGGFNRAIDCSRAQGVAGGCTLTDAVEAQQAEAGVYKGLAQRAGFNCDVDKYRLLGMESTTKREVVELQCKNQPEGAIAFFAASPTGKTDIYDCTKNWRHKQSCSLTTLAAVSPRLTRDIAKHGKSCNVTGYRGAGMTSKGKTEFVEVSCASGPGLMLEYTAEGAPLFAPATGAFTCAEAANIGEGCKLGGAATARK